MNEHDEHSEPKKQVFQRRFGSHAPLPLPCSINNAILLFWDVRVQNQHQPPPLGCPPQGYKLRKPQMWLMQGAEVYFSTNTCEFWVAFEVPKSAKWQNSVGTCRNSILSMKSCSVPRAEKKNWTSQKNKARLSQEITAFRAWSLCRNRQPWIVPKGNSEALSFWKSRLRNLKSRTENLKPQTRSHVFQGW